MPPHWLTHVSVDSVSVCIPITVCVLILIAFLVTFTFLFLPVFLLNLNFLFSLNREGCLCIVRKEHIRAFAEPEDSIPPTSAKDLLELISLATVWEDKAISGEQYNFMVDEWIVIIWSSMGWRSGELSWSGGQ